MRVVINGWFLNQPQTGSGQYLQNLLACLLRIGPEHDYVLVTPEGDRWVTSREQLAGSLLVTRKLGLGKVGFEQVTFPRACRRLGADLAHVPYWASPLTPAVPTLVTIYDLIPLLLPEYRDSLLVRLYFWLVQRTARRAALALTDSEAAKRDIVAHLGLPEGRVRVTYLAAGVAFSPEPRPDDQAVRARYGLPGEYVLYLGGFDPRKNVSGLLQVWRLAQERVGLPLAVVGRLPEGSGWATDPRQIAQSLALDSQTLLFPGYVEEAHKPAVYRGAVCFLFPSRYEGFGLPALEALSCGVPVIGSNASSIPEVVGAGGLLFEPGDVQGMAEALASVVADADLRGSLSRQALAQAAQFSWERTARETLAAYEEVKG